MAKTMHYPLIKKCDKRGQISGNCQISLWHKGIPLWQGGHLRLFKTVFEGLKGTLAEMACLPLAQQGAVGHTVAGLPRRCGD